MSRALRKGLLLPVLALLVFTLAGSAALAQETTDQKAAGQEAQGRAKKELRIQEVGQESSGSLSPTQKRAEGGYLVPDQATFDKDKAQANARAEQSSGASTAAESPSSPTTQAPVTFNSFAGQQDPQIGPSDSTGAVGPSRYIELVNTRFGIYSKTGGLIAQGSLQGLTGTPADRNVFDPQIIWDAQTNRFYYMADDIVSDRDNRLAFGFSKTPAPSSAADFCHYEMTGFGTDFPDYPKLGDTQSFLLAGTNTFDAVTSGFLGSDLYSITKPLAGTTCPAVGSFTFDSQLSLPSSFTPVPANQIDASDTGYVVARSSSLPSTSLRLFNITNGGGGNMVVSSVRSVTVPSYNVPANAPQPGTTRKLDTLDARNTQAVSAIDPRTGRVALWTQHTTAVSATNPASQVRWYEINPSVAPPNLVQRGVVTGTSGRYIFNGAISPDRQVLGTIRRFGNSMVLNFNSSSSTQRPDIRTVSRIGPNPQSGQVLVKSSLASLNDFTCNRPEQPGVCRWGDYAGASPDPNVPSTATRGRVWHSNQFVRTTGSAAGSGWGTQNFGTTP